MKQELRILIVEDVLADAGLCELELKRAEIRFTVQRVDTREAFQRALLEFRPDIILSDFSISPGFDGLAALDLTREKSAEIPFVFVSGTIGEDRAVEAMKRGATDYVLKDRLQRLVPVITRALQEARERSARRRAEQRLGVQHAVALVLAETVAFEEVPAKLLRVICDSMGFTIGALWEVDKNANVLRCIELWHVSSPALEQFAVKTREIIVRPGAGIAGQAWKSGTPVWVPEATINLGSSRAPYAAHANLQENLAFPISVQGEIVGLMDYFGPEPREPGSDLLEMFAAIGTHIGQFLERRNQYQKIARLSRIHAVLSGINSAIVRVNDRQQLFKEACTIAVEHGKFGLAWIGLLDPVTLDVTPVAWAGIGTDDIKHSKTTARADVSLGQGLVGRAIRERKPAFSNDIVAEQNVGGKRRQEAIRLGYCSLIVLPLFVEDAVAGSLALFAKEPNFFDNEELKLLTELAADISFALGYIRKTEKLNYLAYYDALTGLPNRTLFHEHLTQALHTARESGTRVAVLMCNVDRFQRINETFGRHAGDALLRELAQRFRQAYPNPDNAARLSANWFSGIIENANDIHAVTDILEKALPQSLAEPFSLEGKDITVSLTTGIAVFPADGTDADSLMNNADAALKRAKISGERYLFYQPEMNAIVAETLVLENKMRRALEKEQFVLHYQPRVSLADGSISGLEALIRWNDPDTGLVPPVQFIPLLEETGMILEAGRWAIERALVDYREWKTRGLQPPRIAVNVSPIQLRQRDFVDVVRRTIADSGIPPQSLELEITESLIMADIEGNFKKLCAIRDMGVDIAIDDFGTGYSSLGYLAKLPVTALKIDRSFIITMAKEPKSITIVSTIISLARSLKLKVVAEGVDSEEQSRLLRLLKCDEMQGFLFSKPLPADELAHLLRENLG